MDKPEPTRETPASVPSPGFVFETLSAFRRSAALASAIEMDVFTAIGQAGATLSELAASLGAAERGVRILCDYLTVLGFLGRKEGRYELTPVSETYLDSRSPQFLGGASAFLNGEFMQRCFAATTQAVRDGGGAVDGAGTMGPDHPIWVEFARGMAPMAASNAKELGRRLSQDLPQAPKRILDVAAGHGLYGLELAKQYPEAQLVALDWTNVLEVAKDNVRREGLSERFHWLEGDALTMDIEGPFDLILLTAFLHHFDSPTCVAFLKRMHSALSSQGALAVVETVPNEDRISPPATAGFAFVMLATTPGGDAYVASEWQHMFAEAGFSDCRWSELLAGSDQSLLLARRSLDDS